MQKPTDPVLPQGTLPNRRPATFHETPLPQPEPVREDLGPLVGRTFGGYEIVSYIGEGPSGAIYRGEDLLGNTMAVKVLHPGLANRDRTNRLRQDLLALSGLDNPLLQTIYDTGYGEEGQFYYVSDELVGCDLETGLEDSGGLPPRKSYEIVRAVAQALDAAHRAGIIHGGLRPRNVFLVPADRGTTVKVLDFGAARLGGGSERGVIAGLPVYLAPEQLAQGGDATPRSDLYALGVLMHELFSGAQPAWKGGARAILGGRRGPVVPPTGPAGADARLGKLILSLLESDAALRPSSAAAVLAELEAWAKGAQVLLDPTHPAVPRRRGTASMSGSIGPDSTMRMSRFDAIALAQETLPLGQASQASESEPVHTSPTPRIQSSEMEPESVIEEPVIEGKHTMAQNPTDQPPTPNTAPSDPNASESVEASLEDFISQANATFPATDGWDLHTGDVELIEDESTGLPIAQVRQKNEMLATAPAPVQAPITTAAQTGLPLSSAVAAEMPRRVTERTEVISQPLSHAPATSWTHNPLIVGGMLLGSVVIGAGVMFMMIRTMIPTQQPTQVIVTQPLTPTTGVPPVVTQLPPAANVVAPTTAAPATPAITTPAAPAATAAPTTAAPVAAPAAPVVTQLPSAAETPQIEATAPKKTAKHAAKAPPKKEAAAAPKKEVAAPKPAKAATSGSEDKPKKKGGSGGDWVDPFAN